MCGLNFSPILSLFRVSAQDHFYARSVSGVRKAAPVDTSAILSLGGIMINRIRRYTAIGKWIIGLCFVISMILSVHEATASNAAIYVTNFSGNTIARANIDGTGGVSLGNLNGTLSNPIGVALDTVHGKMYVANYGSGTISQANIDGTGGVSLGNIGGFLSGPYSIALDIAAGKMYVVNYNTSIVVKANLDGTGAVSLGNIGGFLNGPTGLQLDVAAGTMYITSFTSNSVVKANLDGTGAVNLGNIGGFLNGPHDIALNTSAGKMYITNYWSSQVVQANLDGTGAVNFGNVGGILNGATGIALDAADGRIYVNDISNSTLTQANLNGTGVISLGNLNGTVSGPQRITLLLPVKYKGDGALPSGTGGWAQPPVAAEVTCLECHGSGANHYQCGGFCPDPTNVRDKSSYLKTGHKNMLRKVSPGSPWAGADGNAYGITDDLYGSGSIYNWTSGTVNVGGTGTIKQLFYIFGGYMDRSQLNTIFDGGFTGEQYPNGNYDCGRCHTTGYRFGALGPEPSTYNGIPITDAQFSRIPTDYTSGTSSWYLNGIQCERCHRDVANEVGGHNCYIGGVYNPAYTSFNSCTAAAGTWTVVKPTFQNATALCIECHRQESADTVSNTITLGTDLMVSDGGSCSDGTSPDHAACVAAGKTWNYAPFFDASIGQAFLNSPHARFSGILTQNTQNSPDLSVSMTGIYSSHFENFTPGPDLGKNNGCNGCHDVHQSTIKEVNAAAPIASECGIACHSNQGVLSSIKHPGGTGTPIGDGTDVEGACAACHMPNGYHLFRINVDAAYSTFPTVTQYYAGGQTIGNTARPDVGSVSAWDAVWVDLDLACGRCHGGSAGPGATTNGAMYFDKNYLAALAAGMHTSQNLPPTVGNTGKTVSGLTVSFTDNSSENNFKGMGALTVEVNWGDGRASFGPGGNSFSHTYSVSGTYNIVHTVSEPGNLYASEFLPVTLSSTAGTFSITANTAPTSPAGVLFILKANGVTKATQVGTSAIFSSLAPGAYTVAAYKQGVTFTGSPASVIITNANQVITFAHTP